MYSSGFTQHVPSSRLATVGPEENCSIHKGVHLVRRIVVWQRESTFFDDLLKLGRQCSRMGTSTQRPNKTKTFHTDWEWSQLNLIDLFRISRKPIWQTSWSVPRIIYFGVSIFRPLQLLTIISKPIGNEKHTKTWKIWKSKFQCLQHLNCNECRQIEHKRSMVWTQKWYTKKESEQYTLLFLFHLQICYQWHQTKNLNEKAIRSKPPGRNTLGRTRV